MTHSVWMVGQVFAGLFGLIIGSFLNVCILRWPEDRSVITPRSHCPRCGTTLQPIDLIPVVSWVVLGGKCRTCKAPVSPQYALIEILGMLLSLLAWRRFVPGPEALDAATFAAWLTFYSFLCMLVIATYADLRHRIIPDEVSIYATPVAIAMMGGLEALGYDGWGAIGLKQSILGAAVGGGGLAVAALVTAFLMRREGLGWGDVKLLGLIGAFVGPVPVIFAVLLLGSILGSVTGILHLLVTKRRSLLPFGASLAPAAAAWVLYGDLFFPLFFPGIALRMGIG